MKVSDLLPGDIISNYTTFGGRIYIHQVIRVGFTHTFGHKSFSYGIYQASGYEFICDGIKYISEIKKGFTLDSDSCEVRRLGIIIN
jgi:hypothetical protein